MRACTREANAIELNFNLSTALCLPSIYLSLSLSRSLLLLRFLSPPPPPSSLFFGANFQKPIFVARAACALDENVKFKPSKLARSLAGRETRRRRRLASVSLELTVLAHKLIRSLACWWSSSNNNNEKPQSSNDQSEEEEDNKGAVETFRPSLRHSAAWPAKQVRVCARARAHSQKPLSLARSLARWRACAAL